MKKPTGRSAFSFLAVAQCQINRTRQQSPPAIQHNSPPRRLSISRAHVGATRRGDRGSMILLGTLFNDTSLCHQMQEDRMEPGFCGFDSLEFYVT
ncbi:MAG TPA: hypothetical protein VFV11_09660, partial [Solimonas sp.]|nr:hypothetical protein [Solimonas sp.]